MKTAKMLGLGQSKKIRNSTMENNKNSLNLSKYNFNAQSPLGFLTLSAYLLLSSFFKPLARILGWVIGVALVCDSIHYTLTALSHAFLNDGNYAWLAFILVLGLFLMCIHFTLGVVCMVLFFALNILYNLFFNPTNNLKADPIWADYLMRGIWESICHPLKTMDCIERWLQYGGDPEGIKGDEWIN